MNDLFDLQVGTDSETYPRALYAPHPVLSGMTTRTGLAVRALLVNVVDLAILVVLVVERGWPIAAFALGGFLLSVAYTAPPLRLKKHGLGEPTVFVVWGPLMVGGTYFAAVGSVSWEVVLASIPYALLCTAVLMGKHIDKIPWDEPDGTRTLPVILGERRARAATRIMMASFYPLVGVLVAIGHAPDPLAPVSRRAGSPRARVEAVQPAEARGAPGGLPHLAAVVRGDRVRPHAARGRAARGRDAPRRAHRRLITPRTRALGPRGPESPIRGPFYSAIAGTASNLDLVRRGVLIISASMGAGHDGAAYELQRRLEAQGIEVRVVDYLEMIPFAPRRLRRAGPTCSSCSASPWTYDLTYQAFNRGIGALMWGPVVRIDEPRDPTPSASASSTDPPRRGRLHVSARVARARPDAQEEVAARPRRHVPHRLRRASAVGPPRRRPAPRGEPALGRDRRQARRQDERRVRAARRGQVPRCGARPPRRVA